MDLDAARALADHLLHEHGLATWSFAFDRGLRRLGACHPRSRRITLSRAFVQRNPEARVRETLLHEIAHALEPDDGHGPAWRARCRALGIPAERLADPAGLELPPPRGFLVCDGCGLRAGRYRRPGRPLWCGRCAEAHGGPSARSRLRWEAA